jgi:hypothetical protein
MADAGCRGTGSSRGRDDGSPPVTVAPPSPPRARIVRDELGDRMLQLRERCEDGDRRACVRLGIINGENRERRAAWRREHPDVFFYDETSDQPRRCEPNAGLIVLPEQLSERGFVSTAEPV